MFKILHDISIALQAGHALENPRVWTNRAELATNLIVLVNFGLGVLALFGVDVSALTHTDVGNLSIALSTAIVWIVNKLHVASNPAAGRLSNKGDI